MKTASAPPLRPGAPTPRWLAIVEPPPLFFVTDGLPMNMMAINFPPSHLCVDTLQELHESFEFHARILGISDYGFSLTDHAEWFIRHADGARFQLCAPLYPAGGTLSEDPDQKFILLLRLEA